MSDHLLAFQRLTRARLRRLWWAGQVLDDLAFRDVTPSEAHLSRFRHLWLVQRAAANEERRLRPLSPWTDDAVFRNVGQAIYEGASAMSTPTIPPS